MARSGREIFRGIVRGNAPADLHTSRPGGKRREGLVPRLLIIRRILPVEQDNMSAGKAVPAVKCSILPGVLPGNEILRRAVSLVPEGAADDLLDLSVVNIDTGPKTHVRLLCKKVRRFLLRTFFMIHFLNS